LDFEFRISDLVADSSHGGEFSVMPFVFLLVFALVSFQGRWPDPPQWFGPGVGFYLGLFAPLTMVTLFWLMAAWRTHQFCCRLSEHPTEHAWLWRRFLNIRRRQTLLLTACYLGVLFGLGWGFVGKEWASEMHLTALTEFLLFAPYLAALLLGWTQSYRAERASHRLAQVSEPFIGAWAYLGFQVRHNLLLVVPPIVLTLALRGFLLAFPALEQYDSVLAAAGVVLLVGAIVSVPLILRVFLGLRPLADGPLRQRLEEAARRLRFSFNDILVWNTRRSVANAMVSGAIPWLRYIVLTDLLLDRLTPEEVEAVFGHEVGHVKHHHMLLYILFFLGSVALLTGVWKYCEGMIEPAAELAAGARAVDAAGWAASAEVAAGPVLLAVIAVYVFVVFGFLSRRCERQADLYGCRAVSPGAFISALEKVADLNGIPRHKVGWLASWQHPTIAQRVAFIESLRDNPALEPSFQRSLLKLKLGLMIGLSVCLAVVVALVALQFGPEQAWGLFRVR
jgi:Zn-dependent protease with chaperone function